MTILPDLNIHDTIRYAVHIRRGAMQLSSTEPTTDQDAARDMLRGLKVSFPNSVLVVEGANGAWSPVSDDLLDRLARQRAAMVLAELIGKGPSGVNWSLHAHSPNELNGHAWNSDVVEEMATFLGSSVEEKVTGEHRTVRTTGVFVGVQVEVYRVTRVEPATGNQS